MITLKHVKEEEDKKKRNVYLIFKNYTFLSMAYYNSQTNLKDTILLLILPHKALIFFNQIIKHCPIHNCRFDIHTYKLALY